MSDPGQPSSRPPIFLERQTYRRRRMMDAARVLPFLGLMLWLIPLLWEERGFGAVPSSSAIIYLFGVWALLVIGAVLVAAGLRIGDRQRAELVPTPSTLGPGTVRPHDGPGVGTEGPRP